MHKTSLSKILILGLLPVLAHAQLSVLGISPESGTRAASLTATVAVQFDRDLDPSTLTGQTFRLHGRWDGLIDGTLSYDAAAQTARFQSSRAFLPGDRIDLILTSGLRGAGGESFGGRTGSFTVEVVRGLGPGTATGFETGLEVTALDALDLDDDGDLEIAVAADPAGGPVLQVLEFDGASVAPGAAIATPGPVRHTRAGDLNSDGRADLLLLYEGAFQVCAFTPAPSLGTLLTPAGASEIIGAGTADLNADGHLDAAILGRSPGGNALHIYHNNGSGALSIAAQFWAQDSAGALLAADLDGDGDADIAATDARPDSARLVLFLNPGDGVGFSAAPDVTVDLDFEPGAALCADFSGDGLPDVAVAHRSAAFVSLYRNLGAGSGAPQFAAPALYPGADSASALLHGDIDEDGDFDLIVIGRGSSSVQLLANNGSGQMSASGLGVSTAQAAGVLADLNRDGALDFLSADSSGSVLFFANDVSNNTPPGASLPVDPADGAVLASNPDRLVWLAASDVEDDPLYYLLSLSDNDGGTWNFDSRLSADADRFQPPAPVPAGTDSVTLSLDGLGIGNGAVQWQVVAHDGLAAGPSTAVVSYIVDDYAPGPPLNLTAGGSQGASPWQSGPEFEIDWQLPDDTSGIAQSL